MDSVDRDVRKFVFDFFLENAFAPSAQEVAGRLDLSLPAIMDALERLDQAHHLKLLEGTSRILMAFPFSAISTPYRVTRKNGQRYFANCAWDSIAFHAMLNEPVLIESFCDRCEASLAFRLEGGKGISIGQPLPRVRLALPAAEWWKDITRTCANTMVFLGPEESGRQSGALGDSEDPGIVTVDQVYRMSVPIYSGKLRLEYERPPPSVIQSTFESLGLTGPFWRL